MLKLILQTMYPLSLTFSMRMMRSPTPLKVGALLGFRAQALGETRQGVWDSIFLGHMIKKPHMSLVLTI